MSSAAIKRQESYFDTVSSRPTSWLGNNFEKFLLMLRNSSLVRRAICSMMNIRPLLLLKSYQIFCLSLLEKGRVTENSIKIIVDRDDSQAEAKRKSE